MAQQGKLMHLVPTFLSGPILSFHSFQILKQVWPNVGHYVRNIIVESVEPGIRESLASYKLGGFKLDKISLGTIVSYLFS